MIAGRSGSSNQKRLPKPGVLSTPICAAHQLDQLLADRQSEPAAAKAAGNRGVGLAELFEQLAANFLRHADAGIGDLKAQPAQILGRVRDASVTSTETPPRSVNLMALPTRFSRI